MGFNRRKMEDERRPKQLAGTGSTQQHSQPLHVAPLNHATPIEPLIRIKKVPANRRFPPPWSIEELDACFVDTTTVLSDPTYQPDPNSVVVDHGSDLQGDQLRGCCAGWGPLTRYGAADRG
jgi:hypothetical protein